MCERPLVDVAVVGGGIIGLASALSLSRRGLRVAIVDAGEPAQASRAAAGILGPRSEAHEPGAMVELGLRSLALYPSFVAGLGDVGFRRCGAMHLAFDDAEAAALDGVARWQRAAGLAVVETDHARARRALFFPDEATVDNRLLVPALQAACARAGIRRVDAAASALERDRVHLRSGEELRARIVVLCAGSWSGLLADLAVFPVRGQMLALDAPPPPSIVFGGEGYLVPRPGRLLVGATVEHVGFDAATTPAARERLLRVAALLAPGSERGMVLEHWAGLRPGTPDTLPVLGWLPGGVLVATGHFRNGILLAPVTAEIVAALACGETDPVDLTPFSPSRSLRPQSRLE